MIFEAIKSKGLKGPKGLHDGFILSRAMAAPLGTATFHSLRLKHLFRPLRPLRPFRPLRPLGFWNRLGRCSRGLTLIEVILALGLTVLVTGLIGGLIQLYQGHLEIARDNVRQARLARSVLTMIADDIRGVLRQQNNDDAATLEKFLTSSAASGAQSALGGGGGGGGSSSAGGQGASGGGAPQAQSGAAGQSSGGSQSGSGSAMGQSSAGTAGDPTAASDPSTMTSTTSPLPPGIFGTESAIEIDVSRPPRPDEYLAEIQNPLESKLTDIPSDTKTVSYFIQAPQLNGIQDPLSGAAGGGMMSNGGLVRRSLDRAITRWAYEQGRTDQVSSTGQLLASEIVALSFTYFDGIQWTTTWDSSVQGLPWAIQITIAMQHAKQAREMPLTPGLSLESIMALPKSETGLETYSTLALVPGAQLLKTPADQSATDGSTSSSTSSLGF